MIVLNYSLFKNTTLVAQSKTNLTKILKIMFHFLINISVVFRKSPLLILGSSNNYIYEKHKKLNILYDYFIEKSQLKAESHYFAPSNGNIIVDKHYLLLIINYLSIIISKVIINRQKIKYTANIVNEIFKKYEIESKDKNTIYKKLIKELLLFTPRVKLYSILFKLKKVKYVICEDIMYGQKQDIVVAAKRMNIKVFEMQHGQISEKNQAYNYEQRYFEGLDILLPDGILLFGSIYIDKINIPINKILIGSAFLEKERELYYNSIYKNSNILIISQWPVVSLVKTLIKNLLDYQISNHIIIKLHPKDKIDEYYEFKDTVSIVGNEHTVYELMRNSGYIVGYYSTVLFEAIMYSDNVIAIENDYLYESLRDNEYIKIMNHYDFIKYISNRNEMQNKLINRNDINKYWSDKPYRRWNQLFI